MRTIRVEGNIVADAERKISQTGKEYLSFRFANNEKNKKGEKETYWYTVISTHHMGLASYLTKGKHVEIEGDYSDNIYQNKQGECEIGRTIMANAIYFVGGNSENKTDNAETTKTVTESTPKIQTKMEAPKPTTSDLKVPTPTAVEDDEDELPF